jgi:hypothetical protein
VVLPLSGTAEVEVIDPAGRRVAHAEQVTKYHRLDTRSPMSTSGEAVAVTYLPCAGLRAALPDTG